MPNGCRSKREIHMWSRDKLNAKARDWRAGSSHYVVVQRSCSDNPNPRPLDLVGWGEGPARAVALEDSRHALKPFYGPEETPVVACVEATLRLVMFTVGEVASEMSGGDQVIGINSQGLLDLAFSEAEVEELIHHTNEFLRQRLPSDEEER